MCNGVRVGVGDAVVGSCLRHYRLSRGESDCKALLGLVEGGDGVAYGNGDEFHFAPLVLVGRNE